MGVPHGSLTWIAGSSSAELLLSEPAEQFCSGPAEDSTIVSIALTDEVPVEPGNEPSVDALCPSLHRSSRADGPSLSL